MADLLVTSVSAVQTFARWWLGELAALLPPAVRRLLARGARTLLVDVMDSGVVFQACVAGRCRTLGFMKTPVAEAELARRTVARLLADEHLGKAPVVVRLPVGRTLRKTVELPLSAEPDLREALPFQIERHTPFSAKDVRHDYRIVERDREAQKLRVEMVVAPIAVVDEALAMVSALGFRPAAVDIAGPAGSALFGFDLNAGGDGGGLRGIRPTVRSLRIAAAMAMVVAAIYGPPAVQRGVLDALRAEIQESRAEADRAAALKQQLESLRDSQQFVAAQKREAPSLVQIIDEMARLLPDDTWLTEFRLDGRTVQVAGYSASASGLIALIDQSPRFAKPSFRAAVTQDPRVSRESFRLAFELEGRRQ